MEMRECKPVLRILSVYEQRLSMSSFLGRKYLKGLDALKKLTSMCVFKDFSILLLKQSTITEKATSTLSPRPSFVPWYQSCLTAWYQSCSINFNAASLLGFKTTTVTLLLTHCVDFQRLDYLYITELNSLTAMFIS